MGEWTGDAEIRQAVDGLLNWIRNGAPRNAEGILYHVFNAPEMWSDGFNGAPPFLAEMAFMTKRWHRSRVTGSGSGIQPRNSSRTSGMMAGKRSMTAPSGAAATDGQRRGWGSGTAHGCT